MPAVESLEPATRRFIRDQLAPDCDESVLEPESSLIDSGILDSFGIMQLLAFIERDFGVQVPPHEIEPANFETIRSIAALISRHL